MSGRVVVVCTLPTFTWSSAMANVVNAVPAIASAVMDVMILVCFIFLIYWCVIDRRNKSVKERVAKLLLDDADVILSEETDERLDRLMLLIEDLEPPIRQLIFRLRYLQEKSYQEVADEVGVSKVTVFNHLSKAMDWIKKQFK